MFIFFVILRFFTTPWGYSISKEGPASGQLEEMEVVSDEFGDGAAEGAVGKEAEPVEEEWFGDDIQFDNPVVKRKVCHLAFLVDKMLYY